MSGQPEKDVSSNLISLLRERSNPFDSLVRSRLPDDEFADVHRRALVPENRHARVGREIQHAHQAAARRRWSSAAPGGG